MKDTKEENTEKVMEESADEETTDQAETVEELVRKKQENKFKVTGNVAQNQYFVQNVNWGSHRDFKRTMNLASKDSGDVKKYNLEKEEECADFFATCRNREYILLVIIFAVFGIIPVGDLASLKDMLAECLPPVISVDDEGNEVSVPQFDAYLSLQTALSVIGGETFIAKDGQKCAGYGESSGKILSNIWFQFPDLRKSVIVWLLKVNATYEYKTAFEADQIATAFIHIILEDFPYAKRQVFDRLYSDQRNTGLLAWLARELLSYEKLQDEVLDMVFMWLESDSNWLWRSAFLVCLRTYDSDINDRLAGALTAALRKKMPGFEGSDLKFISVFSGAAASIRTVVASVFSSLYKENSTRRKNWLSGIYLRMIRYGYYEVDRTMVELPFVVCDTKEQMKSIVPVLTYIMSQYEFRCQWYCILKAYLEEIDHYHVTVNTQKRITAYFYAILNRGYDCREDILLFLYETKGNIAKKTYDMLLKLIKIREDKVNE